MLALLFALGLNLTQDETASQAIRIRFEPTGGAAIPAERLAFSPDGTKVIAANHQFITAWKLPAGERLESFSPSTTSFPRLLSSSGQCALSYDHGEEAKRIVLPGSGKKLGPCELPGGEFISPPTESQQLPSYLYSHRTRVLCDLSTNGNLGVCIEDPVPERGVSLTRHVELLAASAEERPLSHQRLVVFTSRSGKVRADCLSPKVNYLPPSARSPSWIIDSLSLRYVAFSPNAARIAAQVGSGEIIVWDTKNGAIIGTLEQPAPRGPKELMFDPARGPFVWLDGDRIATGSRGDLERDWVERSRHILFWDVNDNEIREVAWSPAQTQPVEESAGAEEGSESRSTQRRRRNRRAQRARPITKIAISPNNHYAAALLSAASRANSSGVELIDLQSDSAVGVLSFPKHEQPTAVAFSYDSAQIAVATSIGSIYVSPIDPAIRAARSGQLLSVRDTR